MIDFLIDLWYDSKGLFILLALAFIMAFCIVFFLVNQISYKSENKHAVVIGRDFVPAHTIVTYISSDKTMIPVSTFYPDAYTLSFKRQDGTTGNCEVNAALYIGIKTGSTIRITDYWGILTRSISRSSLDL